MLMSKYAPPAKCQRIVSLFCRAKADIYPPTLSRPPQNTIHNTRDVIRGANEGTFSPFPNRRVVEEGESTLGTQGLIRQSEERDSWRWESQIKELLFHWGLGFCC